MRNAPWKSLLTVLTIVLIAGWSASVIQTVELKPSNGKLWVEGTSTIHDWTCEVGDFAGQANVATAENSLSDVALAEVTVPVSQLNCKNGTMDKKARKALKEDDHPMISYKLTEAEVIEQQGEAVTLQTQGTLTIAGSERPVDMTVEGTLAQDGTVRFTGSVPVSMEAFGMEPPSAMFGTIKTGNEVTVHFNVAANLPS